MKRRSLLAAVGAGGTGVALAGCAGFQPPESPTVTDRSFSRTGDCSNPGTASVSFANDVSITGCIRGPNSCAEAALATLEYDVGTETLEATIGIEDTSGPNEACAEVIVHRGYRLSAAFSDGGPSTVVVVHRGVGNEVEAARVER